MEISEDLIDSIRALFIVRNDCFPRQREGLNEYTVVKGAFSDEIIRAHLRGTITVGSFQIDPLTNQVKWICFDFDGKLEEEFEKAKNLYIRLKENGYNPILEFSGRRGYHVWLFIEPMDASIVRNFARTISKDTGVSEIFPKQDKIKENEYGGQVKLPLGVHRVSGNRSFLYNDNFEILDLAGSIEEMKVIYKMGRDKVVIDNIKSLIGD